jgi:MFS family permease
VSSSGPAATTRLGLVTCVLVLAVAAIGFLFDTYELLMFPVIGSDAIAELLFHKSGISLSQEELSAVRDWAGRMLWIAALSGGAFGLLGGWLIDRLGRKTIMIASILIYSLSPVAACFSAELWQLVLFRCTTFIGVCVEMVAAVTWLAELFENKRTRELVIGWTLATASLGGIAVTTAYNAIVSAAKSSGKLPALPFPTGFMPDNVAWRFTLLTGLIPGAAILLLMPFVPESAVWKRKKQEGSLKRPSLFELFSPAFRRTTIVTAILAACGYAAAFGAIQLTPLQIVPGLPDIAPKIATAAKGMKEAQAKVKATEDNTPEHTAANEELTKAQKAQREVAQELKERRGDIQLWQELGGLAGRIMLAVLLLFVPSRTLLRIFLVPGIILLPVTYFKLVQADYVVFATAIFFCGLLTVGQFSFLSEFLPRVFPLHLRGTGGSFATNFGGRMVGTMAATLNTEWLSKQFTGTPPAQVAMAAGVIGGSVYLIALVASFLLPVPKDEAQGH